MRLLLMLAIIRYKWILAILVRSFIGKKTPKQNNIMGNGLIFRPIASEISLYHGREEA